jgi:hypothetical protein
VAGDAAAGARETGSYRSDVPIPLQALADRSE